MNRLAPDLGFSAPILENLSSILGSHPPIHRGFEDIPRQCLNACTVIMKYAFEGAGVAVSVVGDRIRIRDKGLRVGSYHEIDYKGSRYLIHKASEKTIIVYQVVE